MPGISIGIHLKKAVQFIVMGAKLFCYWHENVTQKAAGGMYG